MVLQLVAEDVFAEMPLAADQPDVAGAWQQLQTWRAGLGGGLSDKRLTPCAPTTIGCFSVPAGWRRPCGSRFTSVRSECCSRNRPPRCAIGTSVSALSRAAMAREPEDHLGLELAFLAQLAGKGLQAVEDQRPAEVDRTVGGPAPILGRPPATVGPNLVRAGRKRGAHRILARHRPIDRTARCKPAASQLDLCARWR